jgi:valyl-tRNA synthetase
MRHGAQTVTISAPASDLAILEGARGDLMAAGNITDLRLVDGAAPLAVDVQLAPIEAK